MAGPFSSVTAPRDGAHRKNRKKEINIKAERESGEAVDGRDARAGERNLRGGAGGGSERLKSPVVCGRPQAQPAVLP